MNVLSQFESEIRNFKAENGPKQLTYERLFRGILALKKNARRRNAHRSLKLVSADVESEIRYQKALVAKWRVERKSTERVTP